MNEYNYVRSAKLEIFSVEFLAVVLAVILFFLHSDKKLLDVYIISLSFTDIIYRFYSVQISDILSILIICFNLKYVFSNLRYLYWLTPFLVIGSLVGILQFNDFFGIQYSVRLLLIFAVVNVFLAYLVEPELRDKYLLLYKRVVYLSLVVALIQVVLWYLNFPIAGIFYSAGIARMKGLAHEPSTFCFWLMMSLPFGIQENKNNKLKINIDRKYMVLLLIGIISTGSTSGLASTFVFVALFLLSESKQNLNKVIKYITTSICAILIVISLNSSLFSYFGTYMTSQLDSYISEMIFGVSKEQESGRGGDRKLIQYFLENPLFGIGAFRSSQLSNPTEVERADEYIPGANFFMTTPTEFGVFGTLGMMGVFISWTSILRKIRHPINIAFGFGLISWIISLIGMRTFGFHQPWFIMSIYVSISSLQTRILIVSENNEK